MIFYINLITLILKINNCIKLNAIIVNIKYLI